MKNSFCGISRHEAIAADAALWSSSTMPGWCEWDDIEVVESGHCRRCGSTISRTLPRRPPGRRSSTGRYAILGAERHPMI